MENLLVRIENPKLLQQMKQDAIILRRRIDKAKINFIINKKPERTRSLELENSN